MNWTNVKLIFLREVRDQLRDRRTLFTIAVLPLLLYPLLGMTFLQVSQFTHEQPAQVLVVGASQLPDAPPLIDGQRFHADVCTPEEARLARNCRSSQALPGRRRDRGLHGARSRADPERQVRGRRGLSRRLRRGARALPLGDQAQSPPPQVRRQSCQPQIVFDAASDRSRIADAPHSPRARHLASRDCAPVPGGPPHLAACHEPVRDPRRRRVAGSESPGGLLVQGPALRRVRVGADRRVLPGRGSVRGREGTRHAGDAVEQPGRTQRDRAWANC